MSTSTPPGWYPVTGPDGTAQERWWDGSAWTAEVRPAAGAAGIAEAPTQAWTAPAAPAPAAHPGYGYPQQPAAGYGYPPQAPAYAYPSAVPASKNRNGVIIGIAAGVLVVAAVVGAVFVLGSGKKDPAVIGPLPSISVPSFDLPSADPSTPLPAPSDDTATPAAAGALPDLLHGWRVPRPAAWTLHTGSSATSLYETTGPYDCGMTSQCIRGQFSIEAVSVPGTDAATVARAAMANYAPRIFGELDGHEELTSGPIAVAGATGYAVRWYATPKQGAKGYILMIAVPDAQGSGFVLLHGGVDDDPKAPRPTVLDQIAGGIRSTSGSGT
ncbi:DUF2510 domain-containing protein [Kitasatospora paranensis]|uniref:DUF2510 domain-containing protein n=1 Tax=Kitasatospora paranensis TaxID=258053 RepID=A0ABW2G6S0_9ACTN